MPNDYYYYLYILQVIKINVPICMVGLRENTDWMKDDTRIWDLYIIIYSSTRVANYFYATCQKLTFFFERNKNFGYEHTAIFIVQ